MHASIVLLPLLSACAMVPDTIRGNGTPMTQSRDVSGFKSVEVDGAIAAEIATGAPWKVDVSADSNLIDRVKTEIRGETLVIRPEGNFSAKTQMVVRIAMPHINAIQVTGASRAMINGFMGRRLEVHASGASEVKAIGAVAEIVAELSGASVLDARAVGSSTVSITARGASHAVAKAESSISAVASGASSITVDGGGKVAKHEASGASSITLNGAKLD